MGTLENLVKGSEKRAGQIIAGVTGAAATGIAVGYWTLSAMPKRLTGLINHFQGPTDHPFVYAPTYSAGDLLDATGAGVAFAAGLGDKPSVPRLLTAGAIAFVSDMLYWGTHAAYDIGYHIDDLGADLAKDALTVFLPWLAGVGLRAYALRLGVAAT